MAERKTAMVAHAIHGSSLYQERARAALPLLVRQAHAQQPIYYSDLASELGMRNPRNLNFVLGSIGQTMIDLSESWKDEVPPIQALVINKATGLPGEGVGLWLNERSFGALSNKQQRALVDAACLSIYTYPNWERVLAELSLRAAPAITESVLKAACNFRACGESEAHRSFKEFVATNPKTVGLPKSAPATMEYCLPSGDRIDVLFEPPSEAVGVEVKAALSDAADITRGLFQCIKYRAVLEAYLASRGERPNARAILALEGLLPPALVNLRNLLGIEVFQHVRSRQG